MQRRWTKKEDLLLINNIPSPKIFELFPDRTEQSIRRRAMRLGFGGLFQGSWSHSRLLRETGYNWKQVQRAKKALKQVWAKVHKRYLISDEQAQAIMDYLRDEPTPFRGRARDGSETLRRTWAKNYRYCVLCGTNGAGPKQRHRGYGLCVACFNSSRRKQILARNMVKMLESKRILNECSPSLENKAG